MPQTMISSNMTASPVRLDPAAVLRAARGKRGLALGLGILMAALGGGWLASTRLQPAPAPAAEKPVQTRAGLDRATLDHLDLSSFQRRGALLVGDVTTPAGVRLRLVMDANTRELVGMRVIETEAGTAK
jgi:hypothetical protein